MSYDGKLIILLARDLEKMQDAVLLRVWLYCLDRMARHRETHTVRSGSGMKEVHVVAGQFAYQRGEMARDLGLPPSTLRDQMSRLVNMGKIMGAASPDKQWTLATVLDFERYLPPKKPRTTTHGTPMFEEFWALWPAHFRKAAKAKCLEVWKRDGLEKKGDHVLAVLRRLKACEKWAEESGKYIPAPLVWLNGQRWDCNPADIQTTAPSVDGARVRALWQRLAEDVRRKYEDVHGVGGDKPIFAWWHAEGKAQQGGQDESLSPVADL